MDTWQFILIFIIVFLIYIHLYNQFKTSEDLEIYEIDYSTNDNLQEICELKQPILFQIDKFQDTEPFFKAISLDSSFSNEVRVKDIRDYRSKTNISVDSIPLSFSSANGLMMTDGKGYFFSEDNSEFIQENIYLHEEFKEISTYFCPKWAVDTNYDFQFGSIKTHNPLRYHTNSRMFLVVSEGSGIRVKMTPWKSRKTLSPIRDYENYEFRSSFDIWETKMERIKILDFFVKGGYCLYIPPYWWYSFEYLSTSSDKSVRSSVASFIYKTPMNIVANFPNYGLFFLQNQNIQKTLARTFSSFSNEDSDSIDIIERKESEIQKESEKTDISDTIDKANATDKANSTDKANATDKTDKVNATDKTEPANKKEPKEDPSIKKMLDMITLKPV